MAKLYAANIEVTLAEKEDAGKPDESNEYDSCSEERMEL